METIENISLDQIIQNLGFADAHEFAKIQLSILLKNWLAQNTLMPSQEIEFQGFMEQLSPEIRKGIYTNKPEMTEEERQKIEQISLCFSVTWAEFIKQTLRQYLEKLAYQNHVLICYFQKKYQEESLEKVLLQIENYDFDLIAKEDDTILWERLSEENLYYQELTQILKNG